MKKTTKIPKVGENWVIKTPSQFDNSDRTFVGEIVDSNKAGAFKVRPHGKKAAMPIWFGLPWFVEKV